MSTSTRGACLCGAVTFAIAPPYRWFAHCHCSLCRKQHGSLFGTGLGVARDKLEWLGGGYEVVHYRATPLFERPFCRHCGSAVPAVSHDDRFWHVPAGLLDGDPGARPRSHIFVASRSPLHELADSLPKHAAYPPGFELPVVERRVQSPVGDFQGSSPVGDFQGAPPVGDYQGAPPFGDFQGSSPVGDFQGSPSTAGALVGSCLCDGVAFSVTAVPRRLVNCYCSLCRRRSGAAFTSTLLTESKHFRWLRGETLVRRYALPSPRQYGADFCAECGSPVPSVTAGTVMLPAGAIDDPWKSPTGDDPWKSPKGDDPWKSPKGPPAVHLYVGSKAPWYAITDGWPQFDELPPPERLKDFFR